MALPTLFDACIPRPDILASASDASFAADLAQVLRGNASPIYQDANQFFALTHPTRGLKNLLLNVFSRLAGNNAEAAAIFRLDTSYGGGKTHALIALAHAASGQVAPAALAEFMDPALAPTRPVRVAAFDGENADPANGRKLAPNIFAHTPWGELAFALAGEAGYNRIRKSDEEGIAPGAETLSELIGDSPCLILIDELAVYLRKATPINPKAPEQLTAFLTGLFKAIETRPNAALVFTLALGKRGALGKRHAADAYLQENQYIESLLQEAFSVAARKATLLCPTDEDETAQVLRRRLFEYIDPQKADQIVNAYSDIWDDNKDALPQDSRQAEIRANFRLGYPLHPELMAAFTEKIATLNDFQRVRGMLRILGRSVASLWRKRPPGAFALQLGNLDLADTAIRQEITTRLGQAAFTSCLKADVAAVGNDAPAQAEIIDRNQFGGAPYAREVATAIFFHSLAYDDRLKGASKAQLLWSLASPERGAPLIEDAIRSIEESSLYLDDTPGAPLRFKEMPNLLQLIRKKEESIEDEDIRTHLDREIEKNFGQGKTFALSLFPGDPAEAPDNAERPQLVIVHYLFATIGDDAGALPFTVKRIFHDANANGLPRINRNNIIFLMADASGPQEMRNAMRHFLALEDLVNHMPDQLLDYQQRDLRSRKQEAKQKLAIAIQKAYRHIYHPSRSQSVAPGVDLAHVLIDIAGSGEKPGIGESQVEKALSLAGALRLPDDYPDHPDYIIDNTSLQKGMASTERIWKDYKEDIGMPVQVSNSLLLRGFEQGIRKGSFVYEYHGLVWAQDTPDAATSLKIENDAFIYTASQARDAGIWPKKKAQPIENAAETNSHAEDKNGADGAPAPNPDPEATGAARLNQQAPSFVANIVKVDDLPIHAALLELWQKADNANFAAISQLKMTMFSLGAGFGLLATAANLPDCEKDARLLAQWWPDNGASFELKAEGPCQAVGAMRQFLATQFKTTKSGNFELVINLSFSALPLAKAKALLQNLEAAGDDLRCSLELAKAEPGNV